MSNKIKKNQTVSIKQNATAVDSKGRETSITRELNGFDVNDATIHTMPLEAFIMEYWEHYPEYDQIVIDRFVAENPATFLMMKHPEMSEFSIPKDISEKLNRLTNAETDLIALNNSIEKDPCRFLMFCSKLFPEFVEQHRESAIIALSVKDGDYFLGNYSDSHPHLIGTAIKHAAENQPFGLALDHNKWIGDYPEEVMKAIGTIALNNYDLYVKEFSAKYPQFLIQ